MTQLLGCVPFRVTALGRTQQSQIPCPLLMAHRAGAMRILRFPFPVLRLLFQTVCA